VAAVVYFQSALRYFQEQGEKFSQMMTHKYLGETWRVLGKFAEALAALQTAYDLAEQVGAILWKLPTVCSLVELCLQMGDDGEQVLGKNAGIFLAQIAPQIADAQNPRISMWFATTQAGWHLHQGNLPQARQFAQQAIAISQDFTPIYRIDALVRLGYIAIAQQAWAEAETIWQEIFDLRQTLHHFVGKMEARANLTLIALAQHNLPTATSHLTPLWQFLNQTPLSLAGAQKPQQLFTACLTYFANTNDPRLQKATRLAENWQKQQPYPPQMQ
jgi:tetratricopeptide (TPR) repeat protein